ncbi:HAMP domain-containing histidine kinase [Dysgonomonas sp. OttesenSCG-928-M03]|nr:HAMP domain-containing histidine kinase [Dysgonomonas sp. OttesenSCG-928-M03]
MGRHFIKLFTAVALIAVFVLQAIWLCNMYTLLERDLQNKLENALSQSFQKEVYFRYNNKEDGIIPEGTILEGVRPDMDQDSSAMYFNEFLITYKISFVLEELNSILYKELEEEVGSLKYSLKLLDNEGQVIERIYNGIDNDISNPYFTKTIPIRVNNIELIQLNIESPYKNIFQKMLLLLIASLVIGLIIIYCIFLQIKIIVRQNRIAEIRKDFTHAMVHDMKNPITTILMGINTLKGGKLDDKEELKKQYYDIISKEGEHLLSLTNKILTIAQFEEGKVNLSKTDMNVKVIFDTLIDKYKLVSKKNLQIIVEYNDVEYIYADKEYIYEAFNNLIDNAVKYSKDEIVITINCSKDADNTTVKIKDCGIGISLKDQKRIFEKFERVSSFKSNKVSGFGLGLSYVYQVVIAHDGDIKINSVLGEYSEFSIIIPNKKDDKTSIN